MKKKKNVENKKKSKKKILITILVVVLAILLILFTFSLSKKDDTQKEKKVVDEIKKFSYTVSENDTKLFKQKFKELKNVLNKKDVDNKKYAKLISELFVIDFYTLDNKTSKNDVGGVQFIYTSYQSDFVDTARDGMYKQVKSNLQEKRNQKLPTVSSIKVEEISEVAPNDEFKNEIFANVSDKEAYKIKLSWTYKNNDDFQNEATLVVVKDGDKLSVAKLEE